MTLFKRIKKYSFLLLSFVMLSVNDASAHDGNTDRELAELNDYMMAIQVLRHSDTEADSLFSQWQILREHSWKIRELTDEDDLSIDNPKVVEQIDLTRKLRKALLRDCRAFFHKQMDIMPSVQINLDSEFTVDWSNPVISAPVGSRRLVLVELTSHQSEHSHLFLRGSQSDQILFWSKPVTLTRENRRYTFVYIAPYEAGRSEAAITIEENENQVASFTVRSEGTLPASYDWYNHKPAASPTDINHDSGTIARDDHENFTEQDKYIKFQIRHPDTGDPMPVRVEVRDSDGRAYWTPLRGPSYAVNRENTGWQTPLWSFQPGPFFYIGGESSLGVDPVGKTAYIYHGFEFEPAIVEVPDDGLVKAAPRRWIDMAERGWYSGHTHIHTTDVGLPVQYNRFWPLVTKGEDLGISAILTLQGEREDHAIYSDEYPMGMLKSHSASDHFITYGEEYRNNPYGHLAFLGLEYLIMPVGSGSLGEMGGPDYPPNQFVLEEAVSQGALTIGAHFGHYITEDEPIAASWPSTGFEMPVNAALGELHLAEIYGNAGQLDVWYKLLNSGFNMAATAGPDWTIKDTPRAYVHLGNQPLNVENWLDGLQEGRSFITRGPMLFFTVDGQLPGSKFTFSGGPRELTVNASAATPEGSLPVEIVVNGEVVAGGNDLAQTITVDDSSWIAVRTGDAHSNPVYITFEDRPRGYAEEAGEFIKIIDRLEEWVNNKALFDYTAQRETVLKVLDDGRTVYENIVRRARELGRNSPYMPD